MAPYDGLLGGEVTPGVRGLLPPAFRENSAPDDDFRRQIEGELVFLRQIVRRWHRDRTNAEDLIQDTLLQALANTHLWRPGSNLRGWLFTIMRNQFLAAVVRSKRSDAALDEIAASECDAPPIPTEARLVMRDVKRALRELSSDQRTAVRYIGIDGKSYEEAALLMGMSVAAVRCHLSRGRERLKMIVHGGADASPLTRRSTPPQGAACAAAGRPGPLTPAEFAELVPA